MGRTTVAWQKAASFVSKGLYVDIAQNSAAKCKVTGEKQVKGTVRFAVRTGPATQFYMGIDEGASLICEVLFAADAKPVDVKGIDQLEAADRQHVMTACTVSGSERTSFEAKHGTVPAALASPEEPKRSAKKRKKHDAVHAVPVAPASPPREPKISAKKCKRASKN